MVSHSEHPIKPFGEIEFKIHQLIRPIVINFLTDKNFVGHAV